MIEPVLGILTGISYVSGMDYYGGINQAVTESASTANVMKPNPEIVMVSIDCDQYVHFLTSRQFSRVNDHLLSGVERLVSAGCNLLAIASNTGHICVPAVRESFPQLDVIHIADCCAAKILQLGLSTVGLIGTRPTMEEDYLKDQLRLHEITTLLPDDADIRERLYDIICQELSFNIFRDESRNFFIEVIRDLTNNGAVPCLLGCTEIELLVKQEDIPDVQLIPSAEVHIATIADILLGRTSLATLVPAKS